MNKKVLLIISLIFLSVQTSLLFAADKSNKTMYVCGSPATLMEKPSVHSKKIQDLEYGTKVTLVEEKSNWGFVFYEEERISGWLPLGVITKKRVTDRNTASSANASEIALAGKGFSASIEEEYAKDFEVQFTEVDYIESLGVSAKENDEFIKNGNLNGASNEN